MPVVIAGPCAVEGREQLLTIAHAVKAAGGRMLRGASVQASHLTIPVPGTGYSGLTVVGRSACGDRFADHNRSDGTRPVETVAHYADVLQIGSRNMQNFPLLLAAAAPAAAPSCLSAAFRQPLTSGCWRLNTLSPPVIRTLYCANAVFAVSIPRPATYRSRLCSPAARVDPSTGNCRSQPCDGTT